MSKKIKINKPNNKKSKINIVNLKMILPMSLKSVLNWKKRRRNISKPFKLSLVIESIKDLEPERKCWRLIGGALVEK